ncbi:MAG TPA: hypothetical protein DD392_00175 [Ruminococcus sp.]|nr:hypothetical protein [Ruminococcus sp.]
MSDKIKKVLQTPEVPEELKPENIPSLIRKNNIKKHNSRNIIRYVSAIAACAVIAVCAVNFIPSGSDKIAVSDNSGSSENQSDSYEENNNIYFKNIADYNEIYSQMKKNSRQIHKKSFLEKIFGNNNKYATNEIMTDTATDDDNDDIVFDDMQMDDTAEESAAEGNNTDVYETIQQTEGIAEADIIKANSECIFYLDTNANLISIPVDSSTGIFGEKEVTYLADDDFYYPEEMYLNDNLLTVIVSSDNTTVVFVYDISSDVPELKDSYYQSGIYSDSRMKDSILYLTTNQFVYYSCIENEKNYTEYIPTCGNACDDMQCIPSDDIYIPDGWDNTSDSVNYVNICGTDINNVSEPVSMISIAGYNGEMYCSDDNMYITQTKYSDYTEITRFSFADGVINPEASGTVDGYVLNQFSMDEYDGYFRIATTSNTNSYNDAETWRFSRSNNIFVLDMDMNTIGSVTGIAETESIKSVTFSGNTGYIVTYQQTDPLFAIDFSDPSNPVITDEFKINGYSSFLYQWNDGLLLGFGIDADENGIELGLKLTMFDVSDNGDLKECGTYKLSGEYAHSVMSEAVYDRKALLLSRDRNIIGFPVMYSEYGGKFVYSYNIFSYNDGEFSEKGVLYTSDESEYYNNGYDFRRGIYIGDYIYAISDREIVSADINSMNETDRISLEY